MDNRAHMLPDCYKQDNKSNNYKLIELNRLAISELKKDAEDVFNSLDLMQETGATLDLSGADLGQKRGELDDDQYRYMLQTKIAQHTSDGTTNRVIALVAMILRAQPSEIGMQDEYPAGVKFTSLPFSSLSKVGFSGYQAMQMISLLMPAGVSISTANFVGMFEFAQDDGIYDERTGFGDIGQTIGGYLGMMFDGSGNVVLPIKGGLSGV